MTETDAPAPSQVFRLNYRTHDVDEFRGFLSSYHAVVKVEPFGPELFTAEAHAVMMDGLCISRSMHSTGMGLTFDGVFDGYGLTLPGSGLLAVHVARRGFLESKPDGGLMVDSTSVTRTVFGPDTTLNRITVGTNEMHRRLTDMLDQPILRRIRFAPDVSLASPAAGLAATLSQLVHEGVDGDAVLLKYPAALTSLREAILHLLLEGMPHSYSEQMSRQARMPSPGHVKRAIDFMAANAASPLRLSDIALASGTSVRSLQGGFMRFRGMSPMAHLRHIRLHGVRSDLLAAGAGATVSHIAHTWGFPHLSSFSTLYMRAFGELPSATLRRASRG